MTEDIVGSYRNIILDSIEDIKKTRNVKDPYWARIIADLVSDYNEFAVQEQHSNKVIENSVVIDIGDILKEYFKDDADID